MAALERREGEHSQKINQLEEKIALKMDNYRTGVLGTSNKSLSPVQNKKGLNLSQIETQL